MGRYIDANLLWKEFDTAHLFDDGNPRHIAQQMVEEQPTADVTEVRHGEWRIFEYEYLTCSECGDSYYTGANSTVEAKYKLETGRYYPFCPHCGAKMDKSKVYFER